MPALIRPAIGDDAPALLDLLERQMTEHALPWENARTAGAIATVLAQPAAGEFLVAGIEGQIAGLAYVAFLFSMEHAARIALLEELYVLPVYRGSGTGRALLHAAQQRYCPRRGDVMELEVDFTHQSVEAFYLRHGFTRRERTRWLYRAG